ncbi:prolyl aminopeptidase [Nocardioides sp. CER19]|uniref:prolyl aminopeptidase n=1 Tax=Nocardioides sp. CER19 TaxID=3038538 RepID=UPI00244AB8DB|nr:prolyl aminopeptidase [Nocardioides sp. CER19]MDH2412864.1 prolyl aminopeptidase [Nocardioides sp. CER19]
MAYPLTEPHDAGLLDTGDGHHVYWEVCGNPQGKPAAVLHGGPGSGATPWWRGFFDPERYRVVLLDQRGCGRSRPNACDDRRALEDNTTAHLIADLERLRTQLGVDRWLVFGASWGSTLGLAYAVAHPERVSELVLWAVATTRARDVHWLTHVMGEVYPQEFDELRSVLDPDERDGNIPAALHAQLMSDDPEVCDRAARAWCAWEDRLGTLTGPVRPHPRSLDPRLRLGFARLVTHYFGNHAFLADDAIVGRLDRLAGIPTHLLRGRLDIASPLRSAYEVAERVPHATLDIVEADAHGAGDDTAERLVAVLDSYADRR